MQQDSSNEPVTDLRRRRSVTTRRKIADALRALVEEGAVRPTAEQVAARAGVGLRTVFRHFDDMETLYREIVSGVDALVIPVVTREMTATGWQERLLECCKVLADHYEGLTSLYQTSQVHRHSSGYLDEQLHRYAQMQREMLRGVLPKDRLGDKALLAALGLVLSMDAWMHLRREQGLSPAAALKATRCAVAALSR